jgi:hypothetical protein
MKARCKDCYTILRQREIAMSNELNQPYEMCSDCLGKRNEAMSSERECELYECYYQAHGNSRYCVYHQPIRVKAEI